MSHIIACLFLSSLPPLCPISYLSCGMSGMTYRNAEMRHAPRNDCVRGGVCTYDHGCVNAVLITVI